MTERANITVIDFGGEKSSYGYNAIDILPDGTNYPAMLTGLTDFANDWSAIQRIDNFNSRGLTFVEKGSNLPSSDPESEREAKWLVTYQDITQYFDPPTNLIENTGFGKTFTLEIPCADLSIRLANDDTIFTQIGGGITPAVTTAVATTELHARSPYGGLIEVVNVRSVGRNT
ncbi:hypothetical protein LCGC14_1968250 [marine sediment metagenome]|uniref:Uncharacterized protein n=1 Tax=marine sediment metagenome TaxID=412755 RepID=A0A0F9FCJ8_9ZZZZ